MPLVRAWLVGGAVAAALLAGCGKPAAHKRNSDALPVEIVPPALTDAGLAVAGGPTAEEVEPNDSDDTATALPLGTTVRGKIEPDTDVDRYRIDLAEAGALQLIVEPRDQLDATVELTDPAGEVLARSDRGGPRVREGMPNYWLSAGHYIAIVQAKKQPPRPAPKKKPGKGKPAPPEPVKASGGPYDITARLIAPPAGAEHEPDDDRGQANDLIAGTTGTGFIGWTGDTDYWKVSLEALSAKDALDFELSAVEGVALILEIDDGIGQPIVTRKGARGGPLVVRGFAPSVPQGAPPFHYLVVRADRSNPETAYQLRAVAKVAAPDAEIEPNDTPQTAMPIPADRKRLTAHWSTGDVDCFSVPPDPAARTLDISIDTPADLDLAIDLLVDGKPAAKVDHPGKGAAEKLTAPVAGGAQAVICVHGADLPGDGNYELVIDEATAP